MGEWNLDSVSVRVRYLTSRIRRASMESISGVVSSADYGVWVERIGETVRELDAIHHRAARTGIDVWGWGPESTSLEDYRTGFDRAVCMTVDTCRDWVRALAAEGGVPVPCLTSEPLPPSPKFYDPTRRVSLKDVTDVRQVIPGDVEALRAFARDLRRLPEIMKEIEILFESIRATREAKKSF